MDINLERIPHELDGDSKFSLSSHAAILQIFTRLMKSKQVIRAYLDGSDEFFITSAIAFVETHSLMLDCGNDEEFNKKLSRSSSFTFVSSIDNLKIQFTSQELMQSSIEGRPVFFMKLPEQMLRLQRRESYRAKTQGANAIKMTLKDEGREIELISNEISLGGIGTLIKDIEGLNLAPGRIFQQVKLSIPEISHALFTMKLMSVKAFENEQGQPYYKLGFQFIAMPPGIEPHIQRFISRIDRGEMAVSSNGSVQQFKNRFAKR